MIDKSFSGIIYQSLGTFKQKSDIHVGECCFFRFLKGEIFLNDQTTINADTYFTQNQPKNQPNFHFSSQPQPFEEEWASEFIVADEMSEIEPMSEVEQRINEIITEVSVVPTCVSKNLDTNTETTLDESLNSSTVPSIVVPSLDTLTKEIHTYLHLVRHSTIEVGKRLILAKELVPHGKWRNWLKENFNLKKSTAYNFMNVAERFGNFQSIGNFEISTFSTTQLIALLALPKGEEQNFLALKAAEGTPVDKMSVRKIKNEVKKYNANFHLDNNVSAHALTESEPDYDIEIVNQETSTNLIHSTIVDEHLQNIIEPNTDTDDETSQALQKLLDGLPSLIHSCDLKKVERLISQLADIQSILQNHLNEWKRHNSSLVDSSVLEESENTTESTITHTEA